ncbi:MAG: hypothetical protein E7Z84_02550 [Methanosphaera stadtmanae]|nr:hypothetical protein [Methanosphaera stadtmanae]
MSKFYENNFISLIETTKPHEILVIDTINEKLNMEILKNQLNKNIRINIVNDKSSFYLKKMANDEKNINLYENLSKINYLDNDVIIINSDSEDTIKELLNSIYTDNNKLPLVLINTETYIEETSIEDEVEENKNKKNDTVKEVYLERNQKMSDIKSTVQEFIIETSKNLFYQEIYTNPFMIIVYQKDKELFNKIKSIELPNTEKEMYLNKLKKIYHEEKIIKHQPRVLLRRNEILTKQTVELFETIEFLRNEQKDKGKTKPLNQIFNKLKH